MYMNSYEYEYLYGFKQCFGCPLALSFCRFNQFPNSRSITVDGNLENVCNTVQVDAWTANAVHGDKCRCTFLFYSATATTVINTEHYNANSLLYESIKVEYTRT